MNIGPVTGYENLTAGSRLVITNVSTNLLGAAFPNLNGIEWSVSGAMRGNTSLPQFPLQTIWVTSPVSENGASPAWMKKGQFAQGTTAGQIDEIGAGAAIYGTTQPAGDNNTSSGIVIPATDQYAYTTTIGPSGDFAGSFQGSAENTTPDDFDGSGSHSRSLLYELIPAAGSEANTPGKVLGYFDLTGTGPLIFTAGLPLQAVTISSISRSAGTTTVSFPTNNGVTYRLRSTDLAGLGTSVSSWTAGQTTVPGNGATQSLQDSIATGAGRFYVVEAF
ncbi:MAG TPA: hypothetical protein VGR78_08575 [Verrucomicrobiae bacterium]|nr:hypothetical protein [Verrucomicrobiae bacterium]